MNLSETITVLSLFTLMDIVNLAREKGSGGLGTAGGKDLLGMLSGMLSSSGQRWGDAGRHAAKSGKSVSPQLLSTLLSLVGDSVKEIQVERKAADKNRFLPNSARGGLSRYPEK